ncbi:MAG: 50S ribosomal protein L27 [Candidatus Blackburnbacteria bacterium]|nr:50S ribosomal protein L27 [Candidatus Blackburnbacteria bacterium]
MSKKKQGGKVRQHHQRAGKRLGLKISGNQKVSTGAILVRQRGTKFHAGCNVKVGRDHTLYAVGTGKVQFKTRNGKAVVDVV